jgi:predicted aminopeptidase
LVPAFDALLVQVNGDFPRFYEEVKRLGALPRERREDSLRGMLAQR